MVCNRFRLHLLLWAFFALVSTFAFVLIIIHTEWYLIAFIVGLLLVMQLYWLIHYIERTTRDLTNLIEAVGQSDFTKHLTEKHSNSNYKELYRSLDEISTAFQKLRNRKQTDYLYLQTIVEHIGIGIISFNEDGRILLFNYVAKELLNIPSLHHIEALDNVSPGLSEVIKQIGNNEKKLISIQHEHEELLLTLHATLLALEGKNIHIVLLHNIQAELEEQETQTWQKMIQVFTHEIMNSVTPVISLTSTVSNMLEHEMNAREVGEPVNDEVLEDIQDGLKTIERRATGMLHFVKNYRRLMRLPLPEMQPVNLLELLNDVDILMQSEFEKHGVKLSVYPLPETITIQADFEQLEQVLINLMKNGMEACQYVSNPLVEVITYAYEQHKSKVRIEVRDNGPGIPEDVLDKLFIPFYTTKKQGSGIGLSLSKQIMRQHAGSLRVKSRPGGPTIFTLQL